MCEQWILGLMRLQLLALIEQSNQSPLGILRFEGRINLVLAYTLLTNLQTSISTSVSTSEPIDLQLGLFSTSPGKQSVVWRCWLPYLRA